MSTTITSVEEARWTRRQLDDAYRNQRRLLGADHPATKAALTRLESHEQLAIEQLGRPEVPGCPQCARQSVFPGGPGHHGSTRCRCGSIASGGQKSHCSCAICY